jgi:hypothetical protein
MNVEARRLENLTRYFQEASHAVLVEHVHLLGCELVARGLRGDALAFDLARTLRRQSSRPRVSVRSIAG